VPLQAPTLPPPPPAEDLFVLDAPRQVPEIKRGDVYCSGFVQIAAIPSGLKVLAKHDATGGALATETDYIYLSLGAAGGVQAGDLFTVIRPTKEIRSKFRRVNERNLGKHYLEVAQIQVIMPQADFSIAKVVHSCEAIELGDLVVPFQRIDVPVPPRPREFSPFARGTGGICGICGTVVISSTALSNFGSVFKGSGTTPGVRSSDLAPLEKGVASQGTIIYVDLGEAEGVRPGDVFLIFRELELDSELYDLPKEAEILVGQRTAVGEMVVLKVRERASTAIVTYSTDVILAGDTVERR
jgi:hypothetical protein